LGECRFKDTGVENAFIPLVDIDTFEKCQKLLSANKRNPSRFKPVEDKYILTRKIFCGLCGCSMNGVSGTSKTGSTHRYYLCNAAQSKRTCAKKRVNKVFVEATVLDCIMRILDDKQIVDSITDTCFELQSRNSAALPALEEQLAQIAKEICNVMNAIKQGIITVSTKETLIKLEQDKEELEITIAKERIERPVLSKEQIKYWISKFAKTNLEDTEQKQQLINVFLNSVYVYDDKMLIILNCKDGEICVTYDEIKAAMGKKENPGNRNDCQSSPMLGVGDP